MRPVSWADIDVVTRVLLDCPAKERVACLQEICCATDVADRYRKRFGKQHPTLGSGTLMSAAMLHPLAARQLGMDRNYLICLRMTVDHLLEKRAHHPA